jgi:SOS response regulatory protein OraA/RecX
LQEFFAIADELAVAERVVNKQKNRDNRDWKKLAASLQRRGFRTEVINQALKDL